MFGRDGGGPRPPQQKRDPFGGRTVPAHQHERPTARAGRRAMRYPRGLAPLVCEVLSAAISPSDQHLPIMESVMKLIIPTTTAVLGLLLTRHPTLARAQSPSEADRLATCQRQTVMLLPGQIGEFRIPGHQFVLTGSADESTIKNEMGKLASIVGTTGKPDDRRLLVKVQGTGTTLEVLPWYQSLGFPSELETARALVGRRLWTTGRTKLLASTADLERYNAGNWPNEVVLKPGTEIAITSVEWGTTQHPIIMHVATPDRKVALWPLSESNPVDLTCRFFPFAAGKKAWTPASDGYLSVDPHKTFAAWGTAAWRLIEAGDVAIGMSKDMLDILCGQSLSRVGAILGPGEPEDLWQCESGGKRFVMKGGKVIRFQ
jgi:hypothetical protein